eukprot:gnl/TRDRNA2_/TRDRNA2_35343_c0_seq1.p1 gnl/TRDRNA2_/TRDRNA2_35343_c0~~gnl/TRDRNA2_/TRDRNA2_35343_c0_seq1.p1  ORF type:complete len:507 (+),score=103.62 gnl/TRDRNA2_/TRDRNA2_35343_c0_seq1:184-1704(+)
MTADEAPQGEVYKVPEVTKPWIHRPSAELFFSGWIIVNAILLLVETDHRENDDGNEALWLFTDSLFNTVFLIEMVLRMQADRCNWCRNGWNVFEGSLVVVSIADVWLLTLLSIQVEMRALTLFRIVRLVRLIRIIRVMKHVKFFHQLLLLISAVVGALRAMVWFALLAFITLFIVGMFITRLVGKNCCDEGDAFHDDEVSQWFGTMPRTLFTLFQFMTLEGWPDIARVTLADSPLLTIFYIGFIILTNVTLLNTVAGVLTENVLAVARREDDLKRLQKDQEMEAAVDAAGQLLIGGDELENGQKSESSGSTEFRRKQSPSTRRLHLEDLWAKPPVAELENFLELAGLTTSEAEDLFRIIDANETSVISCEDFVEGVRHARGPIRQKHVLAVEKDLRRANGMSAQVSNLLVRIDSRLAHLKQHAARRGLLVGEAAVSHSRLPPRTGPANEDPTAPEWTSPRRNASGNPVRASASLPLEDEIVDLRRDFRDQLRALEDQIYTYLESPG